MLASVQVDPLAKSHGKQDCKLRVILLGFQVHFWNDPGGTREPRSANLEEDVEGGTHVTKRLLSPVPMVSVNRGLEKPAG